LKLSIAAAAVEAGVTRQTLYKMRDAGKISFEQDAKGKHTVDTAELYRVFQPVPSPATKAPEVDKHLEAENRHLKDQLAEYRERERRHLGVIDRLTLLLEHNPGTRPDPRDQDTLDQLQEEKQHVQELQEKLLAMERAIAEQARSKSDRERESTAAAEQIPAEPVQDPESENEKYIGALAQFLDRIKERRTGRN
jgi:hypothetical protein